MKIQHLRFFVATVDSGGVMRAAERLHLSQPAVSAGLKALEEALGGPLFEGGKGGRGRRLTAAGRRFYRHAQAILQQCDAARADFRGEDGRQRRVRLGVLETLPAAAVLQLTERLERDQPHWRLELWEGAAPRLATWLDQGRLDLAWTDVDDLLPNARPLLREPVVAAVAREHPLARATRVTLAELAGQPFFHRARCELDAVGRAQLRAAGVQLRASMRGERDELIFERVRRGRGYTLAPRSLVPADLAAVEVIGLTLARSVGLLWREDTEPALVDAVAAAASAEA